MMPQPFLLFLMIFMQTDLKIMHTSANMLLNYLLLSISMQLTVNTQKAGPEEGKLVWSGHLLYMLK